MKEAFVKWLFSPGTIIGWFEGPAWRILGLTVCICMLIATIGGTILIVARNI